MCRRSGFKGEGKLGGRGGDFWGWWRGELGLDFGLEFEELLLFGLEGERVIERGFGGEGVT